jgi:hypothetical protein
MHIYVIGRLKFGLFFAHYRLSHEIAKASENSKLYQKVGCSHRKIYRSGLELNIKHQAFRGNRPMKTRWNV